LGFGSTTTGSGTRDATPGSRHPPSAPHRDGKGGGLVDARGADGGRHDGRIPLSRLLTFTLQVFVRFRLSLGVNCRRRKEMIVTRRGHGFWGTDTAMLAALVLLLAPNSRADSPNDNEASRIQRGFAIAPVRLNLTGKNPALVGLGSYLV